VVAALPLPDDPVLRAALTEPVAFWGGVFAGALGLDEKEEPLRGWVERTAAAAGVRTPPGRWAAGAAPSPCRVLSCWELPTWLPAIHWRRCGPARREQRPTRAWVNAP
jgi:hypothetical protein